MLRVAIRLRKKLIKTKNRSKYNFLTLLDPVFLAASSILAQAGLIAHVSMSRIAKCTVHSCKSTESQQKSIF